MVSDSVLSLFSPPLSFSVSLSVAAGILSDSVPLRWHVEFVRVRRVRVGIPSVVHLLLSHIRCRRRRKEWLHSGRKIIVSMDDKLFPPVTQPLTHPLIHLLCIYPAHSPTLLIQ